MVLWSSRQNLMVINVTPEQIVTRMAQTDLLSWAAQAASSAAGERPELDPYVTEGRTPQWVIDTGIVREQ